MGSQQLLIFILQNLWSAARNNLAKKLLQEVSILVDGPDTDEPSAITDFHFTKFVISGAQ